MRAFVFFAAVGCGGNSIRGEIDGENADIDQAVFVRHEDHYGEGDDLIQVTAAGVGGDLCALLTEIADLASDTDTEPDDLAAFWADNLPEEFWTVVLDLRVDDVDDALDDTELEGADWPRGPGEDGEVSGIVTHYLQPLDEDWWSASVGLDEVDDYVESFALDGGTGEITGYVADERIKGVLETEAVAFDAEEAGDIEVRFDADRCVELEAALF